MVSQITLGNIYQSGGKTVVGGSQSGLDTESIIKALTDAKHVPADNLAAKNTTIDKQLTAYSSMKSLLTQMQSAADTLRNPPGVANDSANIFHGYKTKTFDYNHYVLTRHLWTD